MRLRIVLLVFILSYVLILPGFVKSMQNRPVDVKLGYMPHPNMIKLFGGEFSPLIAEISTLKVIIYYGTLVEKWQQKVIIRPEYQNMYHMLSSASEVDPYNQDVYYFAQAAFTWEVGRVREVNQLLEKGMRARPWDAWLPFYAGFNSAYFLKDYDNAAAYMKKSAELSGDALRVNLASRYFYESKQTEVGLAFLEMVIQQEKNQAVKKTYEMRRDALQAILELETAAQNFVARFGRRPASIKELVRLGLLQEEPTEPYGGTWYFDESGRVRSTSKFSQPYRNPNGTDHE